MSTDPSGPPEEPTAPTVAAVVTADDAEILEPCLAAITEQTYQPKRVFVVGGDDAARKVASESGATWRPNLRGVYDSIGQDITYVWFLRERSRPRPAALAALIHDGERVDASVAGSKVVDAEDPQRLISVGYATDVFAAPYSGLEADEVDQEQYDVIRDVAAAGGTSMLVRRDLFKGLGGVDLKMAPTSAAIDFCQRARLRGGRIVVVPSSVVEYQGPDPEPRWRERAGEIRAMLKAYGPLTLAWALPVSLMVGLVESVLRPFTGRFPLPGVVAAWGWNIIRLPSALRSRWQARRGREAGDEELFRYQTSGSVRLRSLYEDLLERIARRFPDGVLSGFSEAVVSGQQSIRHPAFFVGMFVVILTLVATRDVWTAHLPVVGFSLPPAASATATLGAYAGGWNPAGLGSPEVLRPHVGATAVVQLLLLGRGGFAVAVITVGSMLGGVFGTARMLRVWGVGSIPGYFAGLVLMAGPAIGAVVGDSHWVALPATAALPWALGGALRPWPERRLLRASRLASIALAVGVAAAFVPLALVIPLIAGAIWALTGIGERIGGLIRLALATVLAIPLLLPWVLYEDFGSLLTEGPAAFWTPGLVVVVMAALAILGALQSSDRTVVALAAWGGVLAGLGVLIARTGSVGTGREVQMAGTLLAGLGIAIVAGACFEMVRRRARPPGVSGAVAVLGSVAAVGLLLSTLLVTGPGRAGLPRDTLTGVFGFAVPSVGTPDRVLIFGEDLPGTTRELVGLPYRVFTPPYPTSREAYLNEPRLGDEALHRLLEDLIDGRIRRVGAELAEFGVGWVAFTERYPLTQLFEAQFDMVRLTSLSRPIVLLNDVPSAPAFAAEGTTWVGDGTSYRRPDGAPTASQVIVASNADYRWGPGAWSQDGWRNSITGSLTEVGFSGYAPRRFMAIGAGVWLLALLGAVANGRRRDR
ncbi:MAG TPA: hypothetical protein VMM81_00300 [Acidimicrobiia bacterium]|nr:hypothetical protein [Acidimicrobiia bacterium]